MSRFASNELMAPVDTAWLRMESDTNLMMIGTVLVFESPIKISQLKETLQTRFLKYSRFKQKVVEDNDKVYWVEDEHFNIDNHVHRLSLPGAGDKSELQKLAGDLNSTPLDFKRPLWQMHLVENYQGGCAIIMRIHHCIADGIALVRVMLSITDDSPNAPVNPSTEPHDHHHHDFLSQLTGPIKAVFETAEKIGHEIIEEGKELIQEIVNHAKENELLRKRVVFLENYDMNVARYMVEGCDVWLNNPRRPLEASGTSGMKIIANGGLNFSVLDGWWDEGYSHEVGWKIGDGEEYTDLDYQDELESRMMYDTLEKDIVPTFFERGDDRLPRRWIAMMKKSMKTLGPVYNTNRMVEEYVEKFYHHSFERRKILMKDDWKVAKEFSDWKTKVSTNWNKIKFIKITEERDESNLEVGGKFVINAEVDLGSLTPEDVELHIYFGKLIGNGDTQKNSYAVLENIPAKGKTKIYSYKGDVNCEETGQFGYTLRILPKHKLLINPFELGLIKWAK